MEVIYGPYPWYFIYSLALGVFLAVLYDLLRLVRRIIKTSDIVVNIEDIVFLAVSGIGAVLAAYVTNNGEIRIYGLLAVVVGFSVYRGVVGRRVVDFMMLLYEVILKGFKALFRAMCLPLRWVISKVGGPVFVTVRLCFRKASKRMIKTIKKQGL